MKRYLALLSLPILVLTGCLDDDADPVNDEEVITNVTWTLTPRNAANATVVAEFDDPDGDGGNAPTVTVSGPLVAGETYVGSLDLSNPDENIAEEVRDEDEEHQVFYEVSSPSLSVTYDGSDIDDNGRPLGLLTNVVASVAGTSSVTITLKHEPNKEATGLTISTPDAAGGETDVEVVFSLAVSQ